MGRQIVRGTRRYSAETELQYRETGPKKRKRLRFTWKGKERAEKIDISATNIYGNREQWY